MRSLTIPLGDHNPRGHTASEVLAALRGAATMIVSDDGAEEDGMAIRVVNQGERDFLTLIVGVGYTLRLFVNNPADGLTSAQVGALTEADLTEASFLGYAGASLTGAGWAIASGESASAEHTPVVFTSTANQAEQTVYGHYVTRVSDLALQWFEYFQEPIVIDGYGESVTVIPRMSAQATGV